MEENQTNKILTQFSCQQIVNYLHKTKHKILRSNLSIFSFADKLFVFNNLDSDTLF